MSAELATISSFSSFPYIPKVPPPPPPPLTSQLKLKLTPNRTSVYGRKEKSITGGGASAAAAVVVAVIDITWAHTHRTHKLPLFAEKQLTN